MDHPEGYGRLALLARDSFDHSRFGSLDGEVVTENLFDVLPKLSLGADTAVVHD